MANIYDGFALILKSCSNSTAAQVAKEYESRSFSDNSEPFLNSEHNTWELLAALAKSEDKSTLYRYASIRQWVSKVSIDHELLKKIHELEIIDQELEEELNVIVRKNRILRQGDERPAKRRHIEDSLEQLYQDRFQQLRYGDLTPVNDFKTLDYVFNEYIRYNQIALDQDTEKRINPKERSTWRDCVTHMSKDESLGKYGQALYYTLCGNIPDQCELIGKTWEDVIWIYINGIVEDSMDGTAAVLNKNIFTLALEKDEILDKGDPRILFHHIQSSILTDTTTDMIYTLYQGLIQNICHPKLNINDFCRENTLRFVSTWILFGRKYLGWKEDTYSTALVAAYVELNTQPQTFRPIVIASYAARLSLHDQVHVFSDFLENFDGDMEECKILCKLGKEVGLDMQKILVRTNTNLFTKAVAQNIPSSKSFEITPHMDERYNMFFRALDWLLVDGDLVLQAIQSANDIIVYFFSQRKIYLAEKVFAIIPLKVYQRLVLDSKHDAVCTFDLNRRLVTLFTKYPEWETLVVSQPSDSGSLEDLQAIYAWRDEVERQTLKLEEYILDILESNWLKGESTTVRQIYIPEIIIRYHHLLHLSATHIPRNEAKSADLVTFVTENESSLFDDISSSKNWDHIIQEFSKSLF